MSIELRSRAEVLAVGLEIGVTSVGEVVAWADAVIADEDHPHWTVCELAMMSKHYQPDVARALRQVPGDLDRAWVREEVVRTLARGLAEDRSRADQFAWALYDMAMADELPDESLRSIALWASDALLLADEGVVEQTRDTVIDELIDALRATLAIQPIREEPDR